MQILINKKNKLLKKLAYVEMDAFVFTGLSDASVVGGPDASVVGGPDASVVGGPDASVEDEENMLFILSNIPPLEFPGGSVCGFSDASVEEENGDERLNASTFLLNENNALIGVVPFKNDVIFILFK